MAPPRIRRIDAAPGAKFIDPAAPLSPGLDFVSLRDEGIRIAQQLAGESWTDYNEHDPGVTTLEQLCYALTELAYRAELPIEHLLADPRTDAIDLRRQRLFAPEAILPSRPVTVRDYRKLIVDRVPEVANAWLSPKAIESRDAVNGLYDIEVYVRGNPLERAAGIAEKVRRVYCSVRSVCEDVDSVRVLEPIDVTLGARIAIDAAAVPEHVLARVLYEAGNFLAPEVRRQTLDEVLVDRRTLATVFSGPLLWNGFISDEQLTPRPDRFTVADLSHGISVAEGVVGVRDIEVAIDGTPVDTSRADSVVVVPRGRLPRLDSSVTAQWSGVRLFVHEHECRLNTDVVRRELDRLWIAHRRSYDLRAQYERLLALPKGKAVDVGAYTSIQNQFPAVYGINEHGITPEASTARRAQARQFKAYLLVFEQILADASARLAAATRGAFHGPSHQYLDAVVPDVEPLLKPTYHAVLPQLAGDRDALADSRSRFLDTMLATYGEAARSPVSPPMSATSDADASQGAAGTRARREIVRRLPTLGATRGAACDYLSPESPANASGLEVRTRIDLGMRPGPSRPFAGFLKRIGVKAIVDAAPIAQRESMMRHARHIAGTFHPVGHLQSGGAPTVDPDATEISEELLVAATNPDHYRMGSLPGRTDVTVVCRAPAQPLWQWAGTYPDEARAIAGVRSLLRLARAIDRHARRLYVVEHTLLRFAGPLAASGSGGSFEHSFTVSAIVGVPASEARDRGYRRRVCEVLRENTPSHVVVNGCFLKLSHLVAFERLHDDWRRALRTPDEPDVLASRCRDMRTFLAADHS